jgi:hypothetical protein
MDETKATKAFELVLTSRGNKCKSARQALKILGAAMTAMDKRVSAIDAEKEQLNKALVENGKQYHAVRNEQAAAEASRQTAKLQKLQAERAAIDAKIEAAKGAK